MLPLLRPAWAWAILALVRAGRTPDPAADKREPSGPAAAAIGSFDSDRAGRWQTLSVLDVAILGFRHEDQPDDECHRRNRDRIPKTRVDIAGRRNEGDSDGR
jgi:hypothetical protein